MSLVLRSRTIEVFRRAAQDTQRRTTREKVWLAADLLTPIDQEMARALAECLIGTDDDPLAKSVTPS